MSRGFLLLIASVPTSASLAFAPNRATAASSVALLNTSQSFTSTS